MVKRPGYQGVAGVVEWVQCRPSHLYMDTGCRPDIRPIQRPNMTRHPIRGFFVSPSSWLSILTRFPQFYLCAAGVPHLISCRPGTLYSAALMTCDHAANVDCQPQEKPQEEEEDEDEEDGKSPLGPGERPNIPLPTSAPRTPRPRTTVITLAPAKSTVRTIPTVPTAPARPPTTRRTTTTWRTTIRYIILQLSIDNL